MTDLVMNDSSAQSPKRKFSFRFPHLVHHSSSGGDKDSSSSGNGQHSKGIHGVKMRNFSEEAKNVPDLQVKPFLSIDKCTHSYCSLYQICVPKKKQTLCRINMKKFVKFRLLFHSIR